MGFTIESLVELLNKDLELEYSAAIQYINPFRGHERRGIRRPDQRT